MTEETKQPNEQDNDTPAANEEETTASQPAAESGQASPPDDALAAAQAEAQTNLEGWQRARAEFANYKKRTDRELQMTHQRASLDTLAGMLPIIDDFERALANLPDDLQGNPWLNGVSLIMKKFEKLLEEHHVEVIDPVGEAFDPRYHEAIGMEESTDVESGHVTTTLQKGYVSDERVLRPALVRVAS